MKNLEKLALFLSVWSVYAAPDSVQDICDILTSLSTEDQVLTKFNGVFFGDFKAGNFSGSDGSLAIGGSFTSQTSTINQQNTASCDNIGLALQGAINAQHVQVYGDAAVSDEQAPSLSTKCAVQSIDLDFNTMYSKSMQLSQHLAGLFPSYTIDNLGIVVKVMAQGLPEMSNKQNKYQVFTMNTYCSSACASKYCDACMTKSYFQCTEDRVCQVPEQALSDMQGMMLGDGIWNGPLEQAYPFDGLVVFNIPVKHGETLDIQTKDPSAGFNGCNTIYNFYAVNDQGIYIPQGRFTIKRNSESPLSGMVLAPQAHIVDHSKGAFHGKIIAQSYESNDDGVVIHEYSDKQCLLNSACGSVVKKKKRHFKRLELDLFEQDFASAAVKAVTADLGQDKVSAVVEDEGPATLVALDKVGEDETSTVAANQPWHRHKVKNWIHQYDSGKDNSYDDEDDEEEKKSWKEKGINKAEYDKDFDFIGSKPGKKPGHRFDYYFEDEVEDHF